MAEKMAKAHDWMTEKEWLLRFDSGESMISFADNSQQEPEETEPSAGETPPAPQPVENQPANPKETKKGNDK